MSSWARQLEEALNQEGGVCTKATISVDHRISDGAEAAQFMQALAGF